MTGLELSCQAGTQRNSDVFICADLLRKLWYLLSRKQQRGPPDEWPPVVREALFFCKTVAETGGIEVPAGQCSEVLRFARLPEPGPVGVSPGGCSDGGGSGQQELVHKLFPGLVTESTVNVIDNFTTGGGKREFRTGSWLTVPAVVIRRSANSPLPVQKADSQGSFLDCSGSTTSSQP